MFYADRKYTQPISEYEIPIEGEDGHGRYLLFKTSEPYDPFKMMILSNFGRYGPALKVKGMPNLTFLIIN